MRVITIPHPRVRAFPPDRTEPKSPGLADATALDVALKEAWNSDRHFQPIEPVAVAGGARRLAVARMTDEQLAMAPVKMVARVFDVDAFEDHSPRTEAWTLAFVRKLEALPHAKPLYYFTRGGARLIWRLPEPFVIDSRAAYNRWTRETECAIRMFREKYDIHADMACKDPSRLYRLPNVEREEHGEQRSDVHGALADWDYPYFKRYEHETRAEALERAAYGSTTSAATTKLGAAFAARGELRVLTDEKAAVTCPWEAQHTTGASGTSGGTVVFATKDGEGHFHCSHAHCANRTQLEVYEALGLAESAPWRARLALNEKGKPRATSDNVLICWEGTLHETDWAWNERFGWESPKGTPVATLEEVMGRMTRHVNRHLGFEPTTRMIADSVWPYVQAQRGYNTLTDWLSACADGWDGRARNLAQYVRLAESTPRAWAEVAFATWMRSAVARAFEPGCKADCVLVLEGPQGVRKSTLCSLLAKRGEYALELDHVDNSKDSLSKLHRGAWLVELAEGVAFSRTEAKELKALVSRATDVFRRAFDRGEPSRHRAFVFVVTTNETEYLQDITGSRRWWCVAVDWVDTEAVARDLDQLWGQAVAEYRAGQQWHLTAEHEALASAQAEERRVVDPLEEAVAEWMYDLPEALKVEYRRTGVQLKSILGQFASAYQTRRPSNELGRVFHKMKWRKMPQSNGKRFWRMP
ncbi:MAG TPA: VapE domain-containing protein [Polyangiaceae bacterium]